MTPRIAVDVVVVDSVINVWVLFTLSTGRIGNRPD